MSYTNGLDNPELHMQTKIYTGTASSNAITLDGSEDMRVDWYWGKRRSTSDVSEIYDSVRGATKYFISSSQVTEQTNTNGLSAFGNNGFTLAGNSSINASGSSIVSFNWSAGGSAPAITYVVKVVSDSGNKYRFDDFGTSAVTLDLQEGGTYTFDQSDSSNATHPLRFYTASDKSGGEYTTGVTTTGTAGSSGAKTVITVPASAPTLYYQCSSHSGMGGQANTNSLFGSSNFSGSIQSTVSANTTAGFSITKYTGNNTSGATFGHGLLNAPSMVIVKNINRTDNKNWVVYHKGLTSASYYIYLDSNAGQVGTYAGFWNNTAPSSSVVTLGSGDAGTNGSSDTYICYSFEDIKSYSKFGSYTGNDANNFIWTGFRPAWVMCKQTTGVGNWQIYNNKVSPFNQGSGTYSLRADTDVAESSAGTYEVDFLSNGFRPLGASSSFNTLNKNYIYMAFAEAPFVNSNGVPNNAR